MSLLCPHCGDDHHSQEEIDSCPTDFTPAMLDAMRRRALAWVQQPDGSLVSRDHAISEEVMAYDVLDLLDALERFL